jgi:uncharacterized protein
MDLRVFAVVIVLVGLVACSGGTAATGDGSDAAGSDAVGSEDVESEGVESEGVESEGVEPSSSPPDDAAPSVPPLHPDTDHLDETVVTITTSAGASVRVDAKVAATSAERQRGLMEVEQLPDGTGMLFLFEEDRTGGFWMFNTLVPLDIAYIADRGEIVTILAMDPCEGPASDCPSYLPSEPYQTALEVPQGWFASAGVAVGDQVDWSVPVPAA